MSAATTVTQFLELLASERAAEAAELLSPGIEWRNSGWPTIRGARVGAMLRDMDRRHIRFAVTFHHVAEEERADGASIVLTERTDLIGFRRWSTSFWVCGTFRVEDGLITLWDDHFSTGSVLLGAVKGLRGLVPGR
jgi:limonene-1,2-epoxide hydrolase